MEIVNTLMGGVSRESANVLPNYATSTTMGTMTFTVDEDKTIHFNGTVTGSISLSVFNHNRDGGTIVIPKGNYFYPFYVSSYWEVFIGSADGVLYSNVSELANALRQVDVELVSISLMVKGPATGSGTVSNTVQIGLYKYVPRD